MGEWVGEWERGCWVVEGSPIIVLWETWCFGRGDGS